MPVGLPSIPSLGRAEACWTLGTCVSAQAHQSDLSLTVAHTQSLALTFADTELEARFERWLEASTASWELAGSWTLLVGALLWALGQWRLFGAPLA